MEITEFSKTILELISNGAGITDITNHFGITRSIAIDGVIPLINAGYVLSGSLGNCVITQTGRDYLASLDTQDDADASEDDATKEYTLDDAHEEYHTLYTAHEDAKKRIAELEAMVEKQADKIGGLEYHINLYETGGHSDLNESY